MSRQTIVDQFKSDGFVVVPALFGQEEINAIKSHFMALNKAGHGFEGDRHTLLGEDDPLKAYPRIVHPHRIDELSLNWLLDDRLRDWTTTLLGREPFAAQTMFYFKPPGARGQALHQDQRPLRVHPGTCLAAWMAVDICDEENGCIQVVPGSHTLPELCTIKADLSLSFSGDTVPLPPGSQPQPVIMQAGDVLFFNGQVIHGSLPNTSESRFRCALIAHYIEGDARKVAEFYHPILTFDGNEVDVSISEGGGPCGVFVVDDSEQRVVMVDG